MSIIEEVLLEEYNRSVRIEQAILKEQDSLPKGSIQYKHIAKKDYAYLAYRDGKKVVSKYLRPYEVEEISASIEKRKENVLALKELRENIAKIVKALGNDYINEHTK